MITSKRLTFFAGLAVAVCVLVTGYVYRHEPRAWCLVQRDFERLPKSEQGYLEYRHEKTGIVFVRLPGGMFLMGSPSSAGQCPQHEVTLSPFLIAKHEVTQAQWELVTGNNPSKFRGEKLPVDSVSWEDCMDFCEVVGLRLPTEAQWEYACRAGTETPFALGETIGTDQANFAGRGAHWGATTPAPRGLSVPVDSFQPNAFGLYNMHGNVREWCLDDYDGDFYTRAESSRLDSLYISGSPRTIGVRRVFRGGSWKTGVLSCRSANRNGERPGRGYEDYGFRPVFQLLSRPTESGKEAGSPAEVGRSGVAGKRRAAVTYGGPPTNAGANNLAGMQTSAWGPVQKGLRCRVRAPTELERGMPLSLTVEFQCAPEKLGPGIRQLNVFSADEHTELTMLQRNSRKVLRVKPHDDHPYRGPPIEDVGRAAISLDPATYKSLHNRFPLSMLYAQLEPGAYGCSVRCVFGPGPTRSWGGSEREWRRSGYWSGTVVSGLFVLNVTKERPKSKKCKVPLRLRLKEGSHVRFSGEDAEEVDFSLRNGHSLGYKVYRDGEIFTVSGGLPEPDDVNPIDSWHDDQGGRRTVSYEIEIFETVEWPRWVPGPAHRGYRTLWRRTFQVSSLEKEMSTRAEQTERS